MHLLALLLLFVPTALAASPFKCVDGAYPWCVHTPPNMKRGGTYPAILFLPGSGARGSLGQAPSLATYDGVGKIISSGSPAAAASLAANSFITIIPIAPSTERHFFPDKIRSVVQAAQSSYPQIDPDRIVVTGYSMGSRGTWRNLVFNTDLFAAGAPSAGAPEKAGDSTLQQQAAPPTWPLLDKLVAMPIRAFAGTSDETAGHASSEAAQQALQRLGSTASSLKLEQGATHEVMSTKPWQDPALFQWFLQQSRSGSGSNSTSSPTSSSSPDSDSTSDASSASSTPAGRHRPSSASASSAPTSTESSDDGPDSCDSESSSSRRRRHRRRHASRSHKRGRLSSLPHARRRRGPATVPSSGRRGEPDGHGGLLHGPAFGKVDVTGGGQAQAKRMERRVLSPPS